MSIAGVSSSTSAAVHLMAAARNQPVRERPQVEKVAADKPVHLKPSAAVAERMDAKEAKGIAVAKAKVAAKSALLSPEATALAAKVTPAVTGPTDEEKAKVNEQMQNLIEVNAAAVEDGEETAGDGNMLTVKGLLAAWGQNESPYDLNGDGTVDLSDMLTLLQNGGTMPMPEGASEPLTLEGLLAAWGTSNTTFDLNGDGTVDTNDLLALLAQQGEDTPIDPEPAAGELTLNGLMNAWGQADSPYDLNGDGTVDVSDMLIMLENGGSMPMPEGASENMTMQGLLGAWGSDNSTFDLNGDGTVDVSDLLMLMARLNPEDSQPKIPKTDLPKDVTPEQLLSMARVSPAATDKGLGQLMEMLSEDVAV